ncbi:ATP-binding protein [Massilia sp. CF038]|uniref:sensor histidine kinase n=1 Tax=Massilia sp. CF038 TaxID=1881045 RepID=UPI0015B741B8|nr:ATP-binding protein [Massilia sp. CF038]
MGLVEQLQRVFELAPALIRISVVLIAFAWLLASPVWAAAPAPPSPALAGKRVLLLASPSYGRPGVDAVVRTMVDQFDRGGLVRDNVMVEYLNLYRADAPQYRPRLREQLLELYKGQPIDLIIALRQPALDFTLDELRDLAPGVPVFAVDVTAPPLHKLGQHALILPRVHESERRTLEQALRLFPATERVIVTVGAGPADQQGKQLIASVIAEMGLKLEVEYTDALSAEGMVAHVAGAPPHSVVLLGPVSRDVLGQNVPAYDQAMRIARLAKAPVFTLFSTGMGNGPLGGAVRDVEHTATDGVAYMLGILAGTRAVRPGVTEVPFAITNMYDWRQIQRWQIDPGLLPHDTVFLNRPPSVWAEHRQLVLGGAAVIALLSLLSATLLFQRRRLRVAERRFRVLVEQSPEAIVVYDVRKKRWVDANSKAERLFGASRAVLLEGGPERYYLENQPDGLPPGETLQRNAERSLAGEELVFERMVRAADGRVFPCEVSVVALPSFGDALLRGGYVDISDRKRAEQELLDRGAVLESQVAERTAALSLAVQDAQAANRAKSVFLANMSHELRTPLNSIIGFSHIMADSTSLFDEEKHNLNIINRAGHHLLSLINDILELSRIEAGQLRLSHSSVDLPALLREVEDMVGLAARQKGLTLTVSCPPVGQIVTDGGKLRQILLNLVSNAVKFTDAGQVWLTVTASPLSETTQRLSFVVGDTGMGIDSADVARIFDPFIQADTPKSQAGTGLGLTISRQFVRLLGSELLVQSRPGQGSEFSFAIEVAADAHAAAASPAALPAPAIPAIAASPSMDRLTDLSEETRVQLRDALQQLDMRRVDAIMASVRLVHGEAAAAIDTMLAAHRYPALCALLEHSLAGQAQ